MALAAASAAPSFEEALAEIVRVGGDTDTIGSLCGQLLGLVSQGAALPADWLVRVHKGREHQACMEAFVMTRRGGVDTL